MTSPIWRKDPLDTRWFTFDWSQFLAAGEIITSYEVDIEGYGTKLSDTNTDTTVAVQISGGSAGDRCVVKCNIHTSAVNVYETEKSILINTRRS